MKGYKPGDYICIEWQNDPDFEVVCGHVSLEVALESCKDYQREFNNPVIRHGWIRFIPDATKEYDFKVEPSPKGRGAVAVTYVEESSEG